MEDKFVSIPDMITFLNAALSVDRSRVSCVFLFVEAVCSCDSCVSVIVGMRADVCSVVTPKAH